MRSHLCLASAVAVASLVLATPAQATGGFECRPISGNGPVLTIGVGHIISVRPFTVSIREGNRVVRSGEGPGAAVTIGQSWIDARYLWLDLLDSNATRFEAQLRATFMPKQRGRPAVGSLERNGRTWRVRCVEV